jgi:hypothetical protein
MESRAMLLEHDAGSPRSVPKLVHMGVLSVLHPICRPWATSSRNPFGQFAPRRWAAQSTMAHTRSPRPSPGSR